MKHILLQHAKSEAPKECCGVIASQNGIPFEVIPMHNIHPEPMYNYTADPVDQLRAFNEMSDRGWNLWAIYHSHIDTPAIPSPSDLNLARYQGILYIIVSLLTLDVRAFQIEAGDYKEVWLGLH